MIGIYVHVPFCNNKCIYCAFASFVADKREQQKYFDHLCREIENCDFLDREVASIYFGGGTPSVVDTEHIIKVMTTIKQHFNILPKAEITIECNPCSTDKEKLKAYKQMGFNRISFGVQSLDDDMLKFLGRRHDRCMALEKIKLAKSEGFDNISADLILGLKKGDVVHDAQVLIESGVKHISAYMLQIESGTPLEKMLKNKEAEIKTDDETVDNYQNLVEFLQKNGLKRYEISNFALKGYQSKHNKAYWTGRAYLGFGLGAHSFDGDKTRVANPSNFEDYYAGKKMIEKLTDAERDEEIIMLGLRCEVGFDINQLKKNILSNPKFQQYLKSGILQKEGKIVKLNPDFYGVSNTIIENLI